MWKPDPPSPPQFEGFESGLRGDEKVLNTLKEEIKDMKFHYF